MKLEKQVCSSELAKKLEKLGVKQDSLFYWKHHWVGKEVDEWSLVYGKGEERNYEDWGINYISAFTVAELGEMLPKGFEIIKRDDGFACHIDHKYNHNPFEVAKTEADARAKMLIYLIENKLLK